MFNYVNKYWELHGFEIILLLCTCFIILYYFIRIGKPGNWSTTYIYTLDQNKYSVKQHKSHKSRKKESRGETECRAVLEQIYNKKFPSCRPDFLRNPVTGGKFNLELDCFNQSLNLAVEYNGIQHYKYVPFFHKNKEAFYNQKYRDDMKQRICKQYGVILIDVPYTVKIHNIKQFLINNLKRHNLI